jgi:hypothetical protein
MQTFVLTFIAMLFAWRFLHPPLALILFLFLDPLSTAGTAAVVPFSQFTTIMAWGFLLGGALVSLKQLYDRRNNDSGGLFGWRAALVCILMFLLIRLSVAICAHYYGVGADADSSGPLTLIIVFAYLWDRRAWLCFGTMLLLQMGVSLYVVANPDSQMNGYFIRMESEENTEDMEQNMVFLVNATASGDVLGVRAPGQFNNTITMATHAAIGVAAGLALLIGVGIQPARKNIVYVAASVALIIVGAYLVGVSASRGVMMGLVFGILVHYLDARNPVRFLGLALGLSAIAAMSFQLLDMIPEDDPLWGRFVTLRYMGQSENYRIEAMQSGIDAILGSPVLGWGNTEFALEAADGHLAHIGPYSQAILHGVPVGLLAALILIWAFWSDLTGKQKQLLDSAPELRVLCGFGTMCGWVAIFAIMTNAYSGTSFLYILQGIAMWPMLYQPPLEEPPLESTTDADEESADDSNVCSDDSATVRN